jgi:hypothetical protein
VWRPNSTQVGVSTRPLGLKVDGEDSDGVEVKDFKGRGHTAAARMALVPSVFAVFALPFFVQPGGAGAPRPLAVIAAPTAAPLAAPLPVPAPATAELAPAQPVIASVADPAPEPAAAETSAAPDPCAEALAWVAGAGLPLPRATDYRCPSTQYPHQGAACWDDTPCPGMGFVAINMNLLAGTSIPYLHHVVAHEVCHILDFQATGVSSETGADACAAAHGAPA